MATTTKKTTKKVEKNKTEETPVKLSKAGLWLLKHPHGIGKILDLEAVLK
ncbi:MAG: hypothetical protein LBN98_01660 [Prevotellaceae bacterium]|jgi:hypothetical protein|nr:hypothetical protein [Prevotellaceae bacterium]